MFDFKQLRWTLLDFLFPLDPFGLKFYWISLDLIVRFLGLIITFRPVLVDEIAFKNPL